MIHLKHNSIRVSDYIFIYGTYKWWTWTSKNTLYNYKDKIKQSDGLIKEKDALELDIDGGRIWVHPKSDGTSVDIHYFNDTGDSDTIFPGTGVIIHHLIYDVGFPIHGDYKPYSSFFSNERRTYRVKNHNAVLMIWDGVVEDTKIEEVNYDQFQEEVDI